MPCYYPVAAYRATNGRVSIGKEITDSQPLQLACGGCVGCRRRAARDWMIRCHLECSDHPHCSFTTLTYSNENLPITLAREHLQKWLKRLRHHTAVRYFAAGEYGTHTHRPHYHAILWGPTPTRDLGPLVEISWGMGHTRTEAITPRRIAYCVGYTATKTRYRRYAHERIDPTTGELYTWQPPFIQMSRRPGIGSTARQHPTAWRHHAIHDGQPVPVPRYLHEAWRNTATPLQQEIDEHQKTLTRHYTREELKALEQHTLQRLQFHHNKRS